MTTPGVRSALFAFSISLPCLGLLSCGGMRPVDSVDAGRTLVYEPGVPAFDMEALVTYRNGAPGIDIYASLSPTSLVFTRSNDGFEASFQLTARILDERGRDIVSEESASRTIQVSSYEETTGAAPIVLHERMGSDPGRFVAEVLIHDNRSGKQSERRQRLEIPDSSAGGLMVSRIRLEAAYGDGEFRPIVALNVPSQRDSLRAILELFDFARSELSSNMALIRLESDTTVGVPPYWPQPRFGAVSERGVIHHRGDTLQRVGREFTIADREATLEFELPQLDPGIYKLTILLSHRDGERVAEEERVFAVKPADYPRVGTLDQMIGPIEYIARDAEMRPIREAETAEEKHRQFDAFWGRLISDPRAAATALERFYSRVEEANRMFSTYKEGWKTDKGMVYIVMGPPYYVESTGFGSEREVWYYPEPAGMTMQVGGALPMDHQFRSNIFIFEREGLYRPGEHFDHAVLIRHPGYRERWYDAVERWRSGRAL